MLRRRALDSGREQVGIEAEGAGPALVKHLASGGDQVHAVRPAGVGRFDAVVEPIDECGEFDSEAAHAGASDIEAFGFVFGAGEEHVIAQVRLHLPDIGGVRFKDVDGVKRDLVPVLLCEFVQGGNLPPKGRSSVAAEDKHDGLRRPQRAELQRVFGFECLDAEVGSGVAGIYMAEASLRPHGFKRKQEIRRHGHVHHHAAEGLGRLMHGPIDESQEA